MLIEEAKPGAKENCSFCGTRRAHALWMASIGEISCCEYCAKDSLPQLIADALVAGQAENSRAVLSSTDEKAIVQQLKSAYANAHSRKQSLTKN